MNKQISPSYLMFVGLIPDILGLKHEPIRCPNLPIFTKILDL